MIARTSTPDKISASPFRKSRTVFPHRYAELDKNKLEAHLMERKALIESGHGAPTTTTNGKMTRSSSTNKITDVVWRRRSSVLKSPAVKAARTVGKKGKDVAARMLGLKDVTPPLADMEFAHDM